MISPCKGCTMRRQGCHAECRLYLDWAKTERQLKERYKERRAIENGVIEIMKAKMPKRVLRTEKWI